MQGLIVNNPQMEFLRPVFERWVECIDRFSQIHGDTDAPYWHGAQANAGLLAAAAWQAERVALQRYQGKKQRDEGARDSRCDLNIADAEQSLHLHVEQRWPRIARLDLATALQETAALARMTGYSSQFKAGALFVSPWKPGQHASPEELQDLVDDLGKHTACVIAWHFPYAYRNLHNEAGQYHPGIAVLLRQA